MRKLLLAAIALAASYSCIADEAEKPPVITDAIYTAPVKLVDIGGGQRLTC